MVYQLQWSRDWSERWRFWDHVSDLVENGPYKHCTGTAEGSTVKPRVRTKQLVVREQ